MTGADLLNPAKLPALKQKRLLFKAALQAAGQKTQASVADDDDE